MRIYFIFLVLLVFSGFAGAQERTSVFDFYAIGVDQETNTAATQVFRNELEATEKFAVISRSEMETGLTERGILDISCHEAECAVNYGSLLGAKQAVIGSITKLGKGLTIEARLVDIDSGLVVFTDRFSAESIDDVHNVMAKLAKALADRKKIESEIDRFIVTDAETQEPRRKKAYVTSGATLGGSFPTGDSYSDAGFLFYLGVPVRIEAKRYIFDISFGLHLATMDPDTSLGETDRRSLVVFAWDMGGRYVFNRTSDFSPYAGGGIGIHFIQEQKIQHEQYSWQEEDPYIRGDQAMALHIVAGIQALQSYNIHVSFELKYATTFTRAFAGSEGYSHQIGLTVSITTKVKGNEKMAGCLKSRGLDGGCL